MPVTLAVVAGSISCGHMLLSAGLGLVGAVISTAVFMWGYESRLTLVDNAGYRLHPSVGGDYKQGARFLTGLVLLATLFVPWLQVWAIGAGVAMRFILWPLLIK